MIRRFQKSVVGLIAMAMAVVFSAFTTPKAAPTTGRFAGELYWYEVDPSSQVILQGTSLYVFDQKADVVTECQDNHPSLDCLRGFSTPQNTSMGDITATGDDQIKRTQNP